MLSDIGTTTLPPGRGVRAPGDPDECGTLGLKGAGCVRSAGRRWPASTRQRAQPRAQPRAPRTGGGGGGYPVAEAGLITDTEQAEKILAHVEADAVLLLRTPSWARHAAQELAGDVHVPEQYHRWV